MGSHSMSRFFRVGEVLFPQRSHKIMRFAMMVGEPSDIQMIQPFSSQVVNMLVPCNDIL